MPPRVSIILAVWRPHPVYFPVAVASLLAQSLRDFELLIVERASEISLPPMQDARILIHRLPATATLAGQKNHGLSRARADLVAMMDADDLAHPERLQTQHDFLFAHPQIQVLGSQTAIIGPRGEAMGARAFPRDHEAILAALPRGNALSHPSIMLRRQTVLDAGGYDPAYRGAEDYELWSRLAKDGARFANLPQTLLHYRIHPQQMKRMELRHTLRSSLAVKRKYWPHARWRRLAEHACLALPPSLVYRICIRLLYR